MTDVFDDFDFEEDATTAEIPSDDKSKQLAVLAEHYLATEAEIAETEEHLKILNERFRRIREDFIPDKMMELGIRKYVLTDGSTISYSPFYAGKILDEKAYDWLESNGYADAVKQELKLEVSRVDKKSLELILAFIMKTRAVSDNLSIKEKQAIHHMTLGSVIKSLTKQGKELPSELIETFIGNRATVKKGKSDE